MCQILVGHAFLAMNWVGQAVPVQDFSRTLVLGDNWGSDTRGNKGSSRTISLDGKFGRSVSLGVRF